MKFTKNDLRRVVTEAMRASASRVTEESVPGQAASVINYLNMISDKEEWMTVAPHLLEALFLWDNLNVPVDEWNNVWELVLSPERAAQVSQALLGPSRQHEPGSAIGGGDNTENTERIVVDDEGGSDDKGGSGPFNRREKQPRRLTREQLRSVVTATFKRLNEDPTANKHSVTKRVLSFLPQPGTPGARMVWLQLADDFLEMVADPAAYGASLADLNRVVDAFEDRNPEVGQQTSRLLAVLKSLAQGQKSEDPNISLQDIEKAVQGSTDDSGGKPF